MSVAKSVGIRVYMFQCCLCRVVRQCYGSGQALVALVMTAVVSLYFTVFIR